MITKQFSVASSSTSEAGAADSSSVSSSTVTSALFSKSDEEVEMPKFIREAIVDKYGQKTFVKFDKKQIRLAGSIAQAEIENLNGIFTLSR